MNKVKNVSAAILTATMVSAASTAMADWKTYAGTECEANTSNASYDPYGGICNTSSSSDLWIRCPVVRDLAESGFPHKVRHSGRSGNSAEKLTCTLRNMKANGTTNNSGSGMAGYYAHLTAIGRHSTNWQYVWNVTSHLNTNIGSYNYSAHVMHCKLPNSNSIVGGQYVRSCLFNYSVQEAQ
jgi:hypothetical protein